MKFIPFNPNNFRPNPKPEPTPKKKPKAIKGMSKKRAKDSKEYTTLRELFLKDKICQVNQDARAEEVHHIYSGKDRNTHYLDVNTWLAVCRECHRYIHANPIWARENGYLK